jgi:iron complex transport system permease protein
MSRFVVALLVGGVLLVGGALVSVASGSFEMSPARVIEVLLHPERGETEHAVIKTIRIPRTAAAALVGGALALAGLCFQALLRNPLASEYTLGISAGASLGAVLGSLLNVGSRLALPLGAFVGAIATILIVLALAQARLSFETHATILAGIIFTSFANAVLSCVLSLVSPNELHVFFFWFMGSFAGAEWNTLLPVSGLMGLLALVIFALSWRLNALAMGDDFATQIGVPVERTKAGLFLTAGLLTALAVSLAGTIGFVGLVVPHLARVIAGADHRRLVPLSALLGAALCVLADVLARRLLAPNELPVGVITAFIGVPAFVVLARRPA